MPTIWGLDIRNGVPPTKINKLIFLLLTQKFVKKSPVTGPRRVGAESEGHPLTPLLISKPQLVDIS